MTAPYNHGQYLVQPEIIAPRNPEIDSLKSNSTVVLILGVLSFLSFGFLSAIPAWIWGHHILKRAAALGIPEYYVSQAKIGKILGIINTCLWASFLIFGIIFFSLAAMSGS